jgi:hypothetical protein
LAHIAAWLSLIWPIIAALLWFIRLSGQLQVPTGGSGSRSSRRPVSGPERAAVAGRSA